MLNMSVGKLTVCTASACIFASVHVATQSPGDVSLLFAVCCTPLLFDVQRQRQSRRLLKRLGSTFSSTTQLRQQPQQLKGSQQQTWQQLLQWRTQPQPQHRSERQA